MAIRTLKEALERYISPEGAAIRDARRRVFLLHETIRRGDSRQWRAWRELHDIVANELNGRLPHSHYWAVAMTPIERYVWEEIKAIGLPMLPQYPIGRFFADFADNRKKIIIECDGKAYHDKRLDAQRDAEMGSKGWRVFRLPGADCYRMLDNPYERIAWEQIDPCSPLAAEIIYEWMTSTAEGFVDALARVYYWSNDGDAEGRRHCAYSVACSALAKRSSDGVAL